MISILKYGEVGSVEGRLPTARQFLTHDFTDPNAPICGMPLGPQNFARYYDWLKEQIKAPEEEIVIILKFGCGLPDPATLFNKYLGPLARRKKKFRVYLVS